MWLELWTTTITMSRRQLTAEVQVCIIPLHVPGTPRRYSEQRRRSENLHFINLSRAAQSLLIYRDSWATVRQAHLEITGRKNVFYDRNKTKPAKTNPTSPKLFQPGVRNSWTQNYQNVESPVSPSKDLEYVRQVNAKARGCTRRGRAAKTARTGPAPERPTFWLLNRSAAGGEQPASRRRETPERPLRPEKARVLGDRRRPPRSPKSGLGSPWGRARYLEQVQLGH